MRRAMLAHSRMCCAPVSPAITRTPVATRDDRCVTTPSATTATPTARIDPVSGRNMTVSRAPTERQRSAAHDSLNMVAALARASRIGEPAGLQGVHVGVAAAGGDEGVVGPVLDDPPTVEHHD